jgi:RHS repeat-associated protein
VYKQEGSNIHYLRGAYGEVLAVYSGGSLTHWNIVRPDGVVIGRREGSTRKYYHRDHLGSTRAVVTSGGSVTEVYDYMPFGDMMEDRITTSSGGAREKFTSHEFDDEVDLYYMQWRRYIPRFGVFTGVDPMASEFPSWSPYSYVFNNPVRLTDPTGKFPVCDNCDETYQLGSIVENRFGEWEYIGDNLWRDVNNGWTIGPEVGQQFVEGMESGMTDFNIFPSSEGSYTQVRGRHAFVEGYGLNSTFNVQVRYSVGSSGQLSIGGILNTPVARDVYAIGNVMVTSQNSREVTHFRQGPEIWPANRDRKSLSLGSAYAGLPRSGPFQVSVTTGYNHPNPNMQGVNISITRNLQVPHYRVRVR